MVKYDMLMNPFKSLTWRSTFTIEIKSMHGMKLLEHNSCNQCTNKSLSILRDIQIWSFKNSLFIFELFIPHVSIRHCMIINYFYNRKSIHGMILLEHSSCHQCTNKSLSIRHSYLIKRIFRYGVWKSLFSYLNYSYHEALLDTLLS